MDADTLRGLVEQGLPNARVEAQGGDGRYQLVVVDDAFDGLNRVQRQQRVYACINDVIRDGSVHAVSITARTPAELDG